VENDEVPDKDTGEVASTKWGIARRRLFPFGIKPADSPWLQWKRGEQESADEDGSTSSQKKGER